jgi:hypothetical protein
MRKSFCISLLIVLSGSLAAQIKNTPNRNTSRTVFEGQPVTLRLAPQVTTTIRLPEPVNSVIIGDSSLFQAEYSPNEPLLVFVRPVMPGIAQSNLVISTVRGREFVLRLKSLGASADESESGVDLLVTCEVARVRFIEETLPSAVISEIRNLDNAAHPPPASSVNGSATSEIESRLALDEILEHQRHQTIGKLYGDRIRVGIGEVIENGSRLIVPFSVTNSRSDSIELVPPQVQLAGQTTAGIFRRTRWTTVQQLAVHVYQMNQRRVSPGGRADGVVVFDRPPIKQSTEGLFLQIADSAAIDRPTLAPITFRQTQLEKRP